MKKISFFGLGYVGLVTSACLANRGFEVTGYDIDEKRIEELKANIMPIYEPKLERLIKRAVKSERLRFTHDPKEAVLNTESTFITVGTPSKPDGSSDLTYVKKAAEDIGDALRIKSDYHLVVVKSTVTPGTTESIVQRIIGDLSKKICGKDWGLCYNPEFLREGAAVEDTLNPDRIVIGEIDEKSGSLLEDLFYSFHKGKLPPIIRTNIVNAELIKYASNTFLAMKISFINEIANICEKISGADVKVVAEAIGLDKRIGKHFLNAGLGYGGPCLPKDVKALISFSKRLGYDPKLIRAIEEVNEAQPYKAIEEAKRLLGGLFGKKIAILGLSFKPNTDDVRGAVSIKIINKLLKECAEVVVYDPVAIPKIKEIFEDKIKYRSSAIECIKDADCAIIVTEWNEFRKLKPDDFLKNMKTWIVIDGRRIYDPIEFMKNGVKFSAIGLSIAFKHTPREFN
jgi:UDPglucose 6-dehydrogenase